MPGTNDGIGHAAAGLSDGLGQLGEEIPVHVFAAVVDEIAENKEQHGDGDQRAKAGQAEHHDIHRLAPKQARCSSLRDSAAAAGGEHDEQARQAIEHEGQQKEHQAQFDQGAQVEIAGGLAEFIGQHGGNGIAGRRTARRRFADYCR